MSSSWDEARRCPYSKDPGKELGRRMAPRDSSFERGSKIITLQCQNIRCEFFEQEWIVQILPDGTIPDPVKERDKQFHAIPNWQVAKGQLLVENLQDQIAYEQKRGTEIDRSGRVVR